MDRSHPREDVPWLNDEQNRTRALKTGDERLRILTQTSSQ